MFESILGFSAEINGLDECFISLDEKLKLDQDPALREFCIAAATPSLAEFGIDRLCQFGFKEDINFPFIISLEAALIFYVNL